MAVKTFTAGAVLTASDTNTFLANSGLVFVKSQTIGTAVSSVAVTSAFSATYDAYKILITGGVASTNNVLYLQLGSTTTGYYTIMAYSNFSAVNTPASDGNSNGTNFLYAGSGTANNLAANIELQNPFLTRRTQFQASANLGNTYTGTSSGVLDNTTSYTGFTILMNTGTLTGGTITVYGYRLG